MKKHFRNILTIIFCVAAFSAVGRAQPLNHLNFQTSFEFTLNGKVFPAGKYTIERLERANPELLILRNADGKQGSIFRVQESGGTPDNESQVIFKRRPEGYVLTEIRLPGERFAYRIFSE